MGILSNNWVRYFVLLLLNVFGFLLFLKGFFPTKIVLEGYNSFEGVSPFVENGQPVFDGVVIMLVDALRSDFMFSEDSLMGFVHSLINDGNAVPFTAYSNPPTVTLPRLKGITTGGTPSFVDAVLNIADDNDKSQGLSGQDSWLHQFVKGNNKKIHFYGDDTWLKLFPPDEFFESFEGTNSFYVSDFTEVDNNVTRHLDEELSNPSWDGLILHYLGLDHIGHKGGPESPFMKAKQQEMDRILKKLYNYTSKKNTLLILMGDHGMNEIGNHGGASPGETNPGLMFISPKFKGMKKSPNAPLKKSLDYSYYKKINQIDLVPTLSALLNLPIPKNNVGVFIEDFLQMWHADESKLDILKNNYGQLMDLLIQKNGANDLSDIPQGSLLNDESSVIDYYKTLRTIQQDLASSATEYDYTCIWGGFAMMAFSTILIILQFKSYFVDGAYVRLSMVGNFSIAIIVFSIHYHGSSLIEEEHQVWWFFAVLFLLSLLYYLKICSFKYFVLLSIGIRIIRGWSDSGQKYFSDITINKFLTDNTDITWVLVILSYTYIALAIYAQGGLIYSFLLPGSLKSNLADSGNLLAFMYSFITCSISFLFKLVQSYTDGNEIPSWLNWLLFWILRNSGVDFNESKVDTKEILFSLSKIFFVLNGIMLVFRILMLKVKSIKIGYFTDIANMITVFLMHQNKIENIPIFMLFAIIRFAFARISTITSTGNNNIDELILIVSAFTLILQNLSFFSVGNTNLLATVDLSNAYNGVKSYDLGLVGLLTFISTFSMPIYWSVSSFCLLLENHVLTFQSPSNQMHFYNMKYKMLYLKSISSLTFYAICSLSLILSCINLRFHLFIWSVFSPKLLYFGGWFVLMNIFVDLIFTWILLVSY